MKKPNFSWKRVADSFSTRSFRAGGYTVAAALLDALLAGGEAPAGLPRAQALYLPRSCQGFFRGPGDELGTAWAALGITRRNLVWTAGQAASLHLDA